MDSLILLETSDEDDSVSSALREIINAANSNFHPRPSSSPSEFNQSRQAPPDTAQK